MEKSKRITFRMTEQEFAAISAYSSINDITLSKALRRCVSDAFSQPPKNGSQFEKPKQ
jgi:hypothetical protein